MVIEYERFHSIGPVCGQNEWERRRGLDERGKENRGKEKNMYTSRSEIKQDLNYTFLVFFCFIYGFITLIVVIMSSILQVHTLSLSLFPNIFLK